MISDVLTAAGSVVTAAIGWMTDFADVVFTNPIMLLFVLTPLVGLGIGLLKRMISL